MGLLIFNLWHKKEKKIRGYKTIHTFTSNNNNVSINNNNDNNSNNNKTKSK